MQIEQVYKEYLSKMEVLSVQNHIQGQFGVIGSTKVKDWGSSLTPPTPPPPPPPPLPPTQQQLDKNSLKQKQQQEDLSSFKENNGDTLNIEENQIFDVDVVDGKLPSLSRNALHLPTQQFSHQQSHHFTNNQQHASYYYHNHQNFTAIPTATPPGMGTGPGTGVQTSAMDAATTALATGLAVADTNKTLSTSANTKTTAISNAHYAFNNNLLYSADTGMALPAIETPLVQTPTSADIEIDANAVNELSQCLQAELRTAKSRHLSCTEVSLPWDLTPRIAAEIIRVSEREPCGIRGCSIFIEFEDEPNNIRRIASFKMDPNTVSTFELYLTLKQDKSGWTSRLPQFLKNLTRSNTILISPDFTLTKNKLYSGD